MWTALVVAAFATPSGVALQPFEHRPQQQFTLIESGGGLGTDVDNTTVFMTDNHAGRTTWLLERNSNENNWCGRKSNGGCVPTRTSSIDWIDGRSCVPLRHALNELARVRKNERGSSHPWASDTPLLSLIMVERGMMATERLSEYVGPLVDWWRSAQEQLKPCWTKTRPRDL